MPAKSTVAGRPKQIAYILGVLSWTVFVTVVELLDDGDGRGGEIAILISLGPLAMGFFVATWSYIGRNRLRDAFSWIALCVSLVLVIAWPIASVMDIGSAAAGSIIVFLITVASGGALYGWATWKMRQRSEVIIGSSTQAPASKTIGCGLSAPASAPKRVNLPGLFWLVLGLLLACGLTLLVGWVSFEYVYRGPVTMRTEGGHRFHAYDKYVNAAAGVLIVVIGWATAFAGLRYQFPRPLAIGFILGTSLMAIPFIAGDW